MKQLTDYTKRHMQLLGMDDSIIQHKANGKILCSFPLGMAEPVPLLQNKLEQLQQQYGSSVDIFHIVMSESFGCKVFNFLCCPTNSAEAEYYEDRLSAGYVLAYAWNLTYPEMSEFGNIQVKKK